MEDSPDDWCPILGAFLFLRSWATTNPHPYTRQAPPNSPLELIDPSAKNRREAAQEDHSRRNPKQHRHRDWMNLDWALIRCRHHIGTLQHLEVVVKRYLSSWQWQVHQRERNRSRMLTQNRGKQVELGPEPDQRWNSRQRQEQDQAAPRPAADCACANPGRSPAFRCPWPAPQRRPRQMRQSW